MKIFGIITAIFLAVVALVVCAFWYLTQDLCANSVLAETIAPGGQVKAVIFVRDCGATTDFSTQISILTASEALSNGTGNIFVADSDHGKAPRGPGGGPGIRATWLSDQQLRVEHHALARVFKSKLFRENVKVEYVEVEFFD